MKREQVEKKVLKAAAGPHPPTPTELVRDLQKKFPEAEIRHALQRLVDDGQVGISRDWRLVLLV